MIRLMCFKNYKVILVCTSVTMIYNECKVFKFELITVVLAVIFKKNPFVGVDAPLTKEPVDSGYEIDGHRVNTDTSACPLGVRNNRVPMCSSFSSQS